MNNADFHSKYLSVWKGLFCEYHIPAVYATKVNKRRPIREPQDTKSIMVQNMLATVNLCIVLNFAVFSTLVIGNNYAIIFPIFKKV